MIKVPFNRATFAREMKPKISGMNLSLEFDNIESSLMKVAVEISRTLPQALIDRLCDSYAAGQNHIPEDVAVDYLQRAMLHYAIYEHLIFIITRVSNDGVTVKKNDDETTAYKYQVDELNNKLLTTALFWMNELIGFLNAHPGDFPEWIESNEKKDFDALPVNLADFNKWVGVAMAGGEYFMMSAGWIIREVWLDCVCSRFLMPQKSDAIARAVCYEVIGRATQRLAYSALPEPIRIDIDNEMGKNHRAAADRYIRQYVAEQLLEKAKVYWNAVDLELKQQEIAASKKNSGSPPVLGQIVRDPSKKYCYT